MDPIFSCQLVAPIPVLRAYLASIVFFCASMFFYLFSIVFRGTPHVQASNWPILCPKSGFKFVPAKWLHLLCRFLSFCLRRSLPRANPLVKRGQSLARTLFFEDNHRGPKLKISSISLGFPVTIFRNRVLARGFCYENNSHARWRSFFCCFFCCPPRRGLKICWVFQ